MDVAFEYAQQLERYMKRFGLHDVDIAHLAKTNSKAISGILKGQKGAVLKTLEGISNIFGLRYFEFGNPDYPLPSSETIPENTKQRIAYRKKKGLHREKTYSHNAVNEQIKAILKTYKIGSEFLAEEIANNILSKFGETYSVSEIVDRFKKTFKSNIEKTHNKDNAREGRGPKPSYYRLVKK
ncbi:hypothetical protein OQZ33_22860 [Pedobacter sp. MC2016-05]|uniref:hypothetical protein n=1 Tax=Pedobacter sp. MC2016-05 TaxID=2994474 RepID=UPI002246D7DB|nr:hypothetical protein [Pedobacter sp. MC2016-05]MCX2477193.1 hypothetical protein [Pedobacter sp. MC2016-05]